VKNDLAFNERKFKPSQDLAPYKWVKDVSMCTMAESWSVENGHQVSMKNDEGRWRYGR
jgi:hypothetical protein